MSERYSFAVDLLDRHVISGRGELPALIFEDSGGARASYRYRDLAAQSNRFAYVLRGLGVGQGDRVFFRLPNHPAFYYGALGCGRAGAVFIPSSTLFRRREIAHRLRDSGAVVAVTTSALLPELEAAAAEAPDLREILIADDCGEPPAGGRLKSLSRALGAARDHVPAVALAGDDPAFIAYSSGTTGEAKGILHLQRYAKSYDYLVRDWHDYRAGDVAACPAEIGWMLPVASTFFYALRAGIAVLLYREREPRFRPEAWFDLIARHRVTSFVGTPTIYRMLLAAAEAGPARDLSSIRRATSAGEPLPADTLAGVERHLGFTPLDGLGMSECMVYAHNGGERPPKPGSCGRAGRGVELAVLDQDLREVPPGVEGVLCVRRASHPGLMREYWNRPDATAEAFRGDWYWTGDVVRRDAEGDLFFLGRADDVMKCSGFRISPFEVESALQEHPAVLEAAAVESPDPLKGAVVKAFVTLRPGFEAAPALAEELAAHVRARLAPFKVPKAIEFAEALPKTQSGKILRRELRDRERAHFSGTSMP